MPSSTSCSASAPLTPLATGVIRSDGKAWPSVSSSTSSAASPWVCIEPCSDFCLSESISRRMLAITWSFSDTFSAASSVSCTRSLAVMLSRSAASFFRTVTSMSASLSMSSCSRRRAFASASFSCFKSASCSATCFFRSSCALKASVNAAFLARASASWMATVLASSFSASCFANPARRSLTNGPASCSVSAISAWHSGQVMLRSDMGFILFEQLRSLLWRRPRLRLCPDRWC